jgi:predicted nucleic acid-binding protein
MIVIDASLAAKLVIEEDDSDYADAWFGALIDQVVAPDLIAIEVSQAIVRRINMREISPPDGRRALHVWRDILAQGGITLFRTDPVQAGSAAELAISLGHPVKDCVYLELAIAHAGLLVTADAQFHARASPRFPMVELFGS